jgi:hypothetical protein
MPDDIPDLDAPADDAPSPATTPAEQQPAPAKPAQDDGLGDGGKAALEAERKARRAADKRLKDLEAELDQFRQSQMSETEKAIAQAKAQGRKEALVEATNRLARAELRAVAAGKLADPDDAAALIGDLSEFVTADGDVNTKAMTSAIDALVKAKPYLAPQVAKPAPLPGGGATPSNGFSMDDFIRRAAGRGR